MTELSKQLENIRSRHVLSEAVHKGRASLFLSPREAAAVDTEEVYETAIKSLDILIQYDERFAVFKDGLMHPSSISMQRELKTEEENKILDRDINSLLQLLSLFASETPSHAVLEYLIRRYRIHELNADITIRCFLHLHDTKIFARLIQLITLPDFWTFLNGVKKSGTPLPREAIVRRCQKETGLLSCICSNARSAITLASTSALRSTSATSAGADRVLSFTTVTILEMADGKPLSDSQLREILSFLLEGLNLTYDNTDENGPKNAIRGRPSEQWRRASCMIISQISRSTRMAPQLVTSITASLSKSFIRISSNPVVDSNAAEVITTMAVLSSYQDVVFGSDDIGRLFSDRYSQNSSQFLQLVSSIQQNFEISNLMNSIVSSISSIITNKDASLRNSLILCSILKDIFAKEMATPKSLQNAVVNILSYLCYLENEKKIVGNSDMDSCKDFLRYVCQRFPQIFDSCISALSDVEVLSDDDVSSTLIKGNLREVLRKVIEKTFVDAPYVIPSNNFSSLLLSLNHNSPFIRIEALERFAMTMPVGCDSTLDVVGLADASCSCLSMDNFDIASAAWNLAVVTRVAEHVNPLQLFETFELALALWHDRMKRHSEQATSIICKIFEAIAVESIYRKLCCKSVSESKGMSGEDGIFIMLIHFTYGKTSKVLKDVAWNCAAMIGNHYPLLNGLNRPKGNKSTYELSLAECLAKNMEKLSCVKTLETILLCVHETIDVHDISQSFMLLTDRLLNFLGQKGNESLNLLLTVYTPIVLKRLKMSDNKSLDETLNVLLSIFTLYSTTVGKKAKNEKSTHQNMTKYVQSITGHLSALDLGNRILLSVLGSNIPEVVSLLGPCLSTFFATDGGPSLILLNVALSPESEFTRFVLPEDELLNSGAPILVVSPRARAGAIRALASLIDSIENTKSMSETNSLFLLSSIPLLMSACCNSSASIRKAGVALATSLYKLNRATDLNFNSTFMKTIVNLDHNPTFSEINTFSSIIHDHSSAVCMDVSAAAAILSSSLKAKDQKTKSLQKTIMWLSTVLGWEAAHVSISLFDVISSMSLNDSWNYINHLLCNISEGNSECERFSSVLIQCLSSIKLADDETQMNISGWIVKIIVNDSNQKLQTYVQDRTFDLISRGWCDNLINTSSKNQIYEVLIKELIQRPGQKSLKDAIVAVHVDDSITLSLLLSELLQFKTLLSGLRVDINSDDNWNIAGLSSNMQNMCSVLEVTKHTVVSSNYIDSMSSILSLLLDVVPILNQSFFKAVFHIDYCIGLIMDFATIIAQKGGAKLLVETSKKASKSSKALDKNGLYNNDRIQTDIENILSCLTQSRTVLVQRSALQLISSIASLVPESIGMAIQALGQLLSKTTVVNDSELFMGKNGIMAEVLRTFVSISSSLNEDVEIKAESIILPFFSHFQSFLAPRREMLVEMLMEIVGNNALPICLSSILMHAIVAYDVSQTRIATDQSEEITMILLSKASARNAKKAMKNSQSDEFMALATRTSLKHKADIQISGLISLIITSVDLLKHSTNISCDSDDDIEFSSSLMKLNTASFLDHTRDLISEKFNDQKMDEKLNGVIIGLILLQLEFVSDIIENKSFHLLLAKEITGVHDSNINENMQRLFVELSEHLLQLLSFSSKLQSSSALFKGNEESCEIYLGDSIMTIYPHTVGKTIRNWCLNIMKDMQKLLDAPSFVAILEELLIHKDIGVRQNAIQILTSRLEEMSVSRKPRREEKALLLDLVGNLRQTITDVEPFLKNRSSDGSLHIGLAQSALICIDLLSRNLGKNAEWADALVETLSQLSEFTSKLSSQTDATEDLVKKRKRRDSKTDSDLSPPSLELMKLLGSAYLCIGSICGSIGAQSLPFLAKLMGNMLESLTKQGQFLISIFTDNGFDEKVESLSNTRGRLLLLRSSITSITAIISHIPNFIHVYINAILSGTLNLYRITLDPEAAAVEDDIDSCLSRLASAVPPRLSISAVFQAAPSLLGMGHTVGRRFAILLAEIWRSLDRPTVLSHITNLSGLATLLLDYRRVYGDQSEMTDSVNDVIVEAVVELCLKFTEVELKNFLARLSEWRDIDLGIEQKEWQKYSRALTYFQLIKLLCSKLRIIFIPAMTPIWPIMTEKLLEYSKILLYQPHSNLSSKKKRRKLDESESEKSDESQILVSTEAKLEISQTSEKILESIRLCCVYDSITDARYELIMPVVVSLLSVRISFESDETFLEYCENFVIPTIAALASSVNKDLLWKPMNRKILMLLRDKKKAVRIAALKTIHGLFSQVGEEYLLLLPECLPFLSESLEDDALDVAALTQEVVKYIEELSGEKLENYLRS